MKFFYIVAIPISIAIAVCVTFSAFGTKFMAAGQRAFGQRKQRPLPFAKPPREYGAIPGYLGCQQSKEGIQAATQGIDAKRRRRIHDQQLSRFKAASISRPNISIW